MAKNTWYLKHKIYYNLQQNLAKQVTLHSAETYSVPFQMSEAVVWRRSVEKVFLEISQNSHEKACARVSCLVKLQPEICNFIKKEALAQVFSCEFCEISKNTFFTEHLRWLLLKRLSKGIVSLEVTIFTKNSILNV